MANYTTLESLNAVPVGDAIRDLSAGTARVWTKEADGNFSWSGSVLPARAFVPSAAAGYISDWEAPVPEVDRVWRDADGNMYLVVAVRGSKPTMEVDYIALDSRGRFEAVKFDESVVPGEPYGARTDYVSESAIVTAMPYIETRNKWIALQKGLHEYLDKNKMPEGCDLEGVMAKAGMDIRYSPVEVTLTITGKSMQAINATLLGTVFEAQAEVTHGVQVEMPWTTTRTLTVQAPGCGCTRVNKEMVAATIGFDYTSFDYTATCKHH